MTRYAKKNVKRTKPTAMTVGVGSSEKVCGSKDKSGAATTKSNTKISMHKATKRLHTGTTSYPGMGFVKCASRFMPCWMDKRFKYVPETKYLRRGVNDRNF